MESPHKLNHTVVAPAYVFRSAPETVSLHDPAGYASLVRVLRRAKQRLCQSRFGEVGTKEVSARKSDR